MGRPSARQPRSSPNRFARTAKIGMRRLKLPLILLIFCASFGRTWEVSLISPAMARILACEKLCISKGGSGTANLVARRVHAVSQIHRNARFAAKAISQRTAELGNGKNASELV